MTKLVTNKFSNFIANQLLESIEEQSNTVGQLLGNTISRWDIQYIGGTANALGIYPISNTVGQLFGNSISLWTITANAITCGTSVVNSTVVSTAAGLYINTTAIKATNTGLITATSGTTNGYSYLTGGVLMQWGWVAANASAGNITFPIAFPTAIFVTTATGNSTVAANTISVIASNTTTMNVRSASTAAASNSWWFALGN